MKHPVILLELLLGVMAAAVLLIPSVRSLITWDFAFAFGIVLALLVGAGLDYRDEHAGHSWKRAHHGPEEKSHGH